MKPRLYPYLILTLLIILLDQTTKTLIKFSVSPFETIRILPFFNIVYVENIGSAFGMFKSMGSLFFIIFSLLAIVFITYLLIKEVFNRFIYAIILGGAIGNLIDRVIYGYVIDFLDFYVGSFHWPAFNIADSALTIGIFLLLYKTFLSKNKCMPEPYNR